MKFQRLWNKSLANQAGTFVGDENCDPTKCYQIIGIDITGSSQQSPEPADKWYATETKGRGLPHKLFFYKRLVLEDGL